MNCFLCQSPVTVAVETSAAQARSTWASRCACTVFQAGSESEVLASRSAWETRVRGITKPQLGYLEVVAAQRAGDLERVIRAKWSSPPRTWWALRQKLTALRLICELGAETHLTEAGRLILQRTQQEPA